jgi:hypothetical protein
MPLGPLLHAASAGPLGRMLADQHLAELEAYADGLLAALAAACTSCAAHSTGAGDAPSPASTTSRRPVSPAACMLILPCAAVYPVLARCLWRVLLVFA